MPDLKPSTDYNKIEKIELPAIMAESGFSRGLQTATIVGGPIALIGLILPPPLNLMVLGGGTAMGVGLGILSHLNLAKLKREWREQHGLNENLIHEKTIDGEAKVVEPELSTKERAKKNSSEALEAVRVLQFANSSVDAQVRKLNGKIIDLSEDILDNDIDDLTVMDFMLTQIPKYKDAICTYVKLRGRKTRTITETTTDEVQELDDKIISFVNKVSNHIDTIKAQAIEDDEKKLDLDIQVMDRMIDSVSEEVRKQASGST